MTEQELRDEFRKIWDVGYFDANEVIRAFEKLQQDNAELLEENARLRADNDILVKVINDRDSCLAWRAHYELHPSDMPEGEVK